MMTTTGWPGWRSGPEIEAKSLSVPMETGEAWEPRSQFGLAPEAIGGDLQREFCGNEIPVRLLIGTGIIDLLL